MSRLAEITAKLSPTQLREVEDFAEFLLSRQAGHARSPAGTPAVIHRDGEIYLDVDRIAGMWAGLAPEKSDVELAHEAADVMAAKAGLSGR